MSPVDHKTQLEKRRLHSRIKKFYDLLNKNEWEQCFDCLYSKYRTIDREPNFKESLAHFFSKYGPVSLERIVVTLYVNKPNKGFDNLDFAYGKVSWKDREGRHHDFQERWVKERDGRWYTCKVGLV